MALWAEWFPDVVPQVPGCPSFTVEHELRRSAQAFFESTRAWKVMTGLLPVAPGQLVVAVAPSGADQEVVRIESAWLDGVQLATYTLEEMDFALSDDWTLHTGKPTAITMDSPTTVRLYPAPLEAAATGLKCRLSVRPSESSTGIDDEYYRRFREPISSGAKARLMSYAEKSWTNPDMSMMYGAAFSAAVAAANLSAAKAFGRGRIPSRPLWC